MWSSDQLTAQVLRSVGRYSCRLSPQQRIGLGRRIGRFMKIDRRRLKITRDNVRRALPLMTTREQQRIVNGAYENLGITLAELLAVPALTREAVLDRIHIPNIEWVRERTQQGQASILLSGHFGNWEYLAMAAGIEINGPVTIVAHPQKNAIVDAELNAYRMQFGNVIVPMHDAARVLVKALKEGGTVAFLVDQHANAERDPWIEFFGRKTPTYEAPAALALRFGVPIYYAFAVRGADGRYEAPLAKLKMDDLSSDKESIIELTRRHVHVLEQAVVRHPHLWSWQHRRWRHEPPTTAHDGNRYAQQQTTLT
jgi:KDO2-lipid IV(A) lauroyltransferase